MELGPTPGIEQAFGLNVVLQVLKNELILCTCTCVTVNKEFLNGIFVYFFYINFE